MIGLYRLFVVFNILAAFVAALIFPLGEERILLVVTAHLSLAALLIFPAFTHQKISLIDPLNLFLIYVVIGGVAPAYFISGETTSRIQYLMNGRPVDDFIYIGIWYCISLFLIGVGYSSLKRGYSIEKFLPADNTLSPKGINMAMIIALIASMLAAIEFISSTGGVGETIASVSSKRTVEVVSQGEVVMSAAGYLRMVGDFAVIMMLVALAYFIEKRGRLGLSIKVMLTLLFLTGCIIPFVASSRSSIIFILFGVGVVFHAHKKLTRVRMIVALIALLVLFSAMTALRSFSQGGGEGRIPNPFVALAESGNGYSLIGTTHILLGVPEEMDYKLGASYFTWIFSPIPRSLWPTKPDVSLGKEVKEEIMGQQVIRSGRPPSFISEGWINFGPVGLIINAVVFGMAMRLVANSLLPIISRYAFAPALYYSLALNIPALANSALSQGIVRILTDMALILLVYFIVQWRLLLGSGSSKVSRSY